VLEAGSGTKFQLLPLFNIVEPFWGLIRNLEAHEMKSPPHAWKTKTKIMMWHIWINVEHDHLLNRFIKLSNFQNVQTYGLGKMKIKIKRKFENGSDWIALGPFIPKLLLAFRAYEARKNALESTSMAMELSIPPTTNKSSLPFFSSLFSSPFLLLFSFFFTFFYSFLPLLLLLLLFLFFFFFSLGCNYML
jgi:hypothetical protein